MKTSKVGMSGLSVSKIGLGCMGMSTIYGNADRNESIKTIHAALENGMTLFDTGDFYGDGHNECLLREALQGHRREKAFISVKFDGKQHPSKEQTKDNRHHPIKILLKDSLKRLGTEYVDLYQPARIEPDIPVEETIGEIAELVKEGYVRCIGLSETGQDHIRRAHAVHPISWLQIEYSLFNRKIEEEILPVLRELGIAVSAYGVLSRGLLSGNWNSNRIFASSDKRAKSPRFIPGNLEKNLALVDALRAIAAEKNASIAHLAIAWVLSQGEDVIPLIGARKPEQLKESIGAMEVELTPNDAKRIEEIISPELVAGEYYPVPREKWFR